MTPLEELPEGMPTEAPQTDCEAVKKEWDEASKTGRVSAELMQKALECQLVPEDKVKSTPTGEDAMPPMPTREENPLAGEDEELKDLGMAELVMGTAEDALEDLRSGDTTIEDLMNEENDALGDRPAEGYGEAPKGYTSPGGYWTMDSNDNWNFTGDLSDPNQATEYGGGTTRLPTPQGNTPTIKKEYPGIIGEVYQFPTGIFTTPVKLSDLQGGYITVYMSDAQIRDNSEYFQRNTDQGGAGSGGGRITNTINPNYFSGSPPQKPSDMGNMEWYYKYGNGMYGNQFNPEQFYFNPDDKGNAGQTSSPYTRIGNRGNMTPEVVQSNRPFYDDRGINKYTDTKLMMKNKLLNMAEATDQAQMPTGAGVDQLQGQGQEVDEQIQEQLKEALMNAGFNVVDIGLDQEGKIFVTVGQFEDSYMENAQFFEQDFELAEPQKCGKRFKAIAVTPGMYAAKDGTQVELSSEKLQSIAGLFRNKPIVLVDHELARPDSTHEGSVVGFIENSWYDPDFDAVLYKGVLNRDLDLAEIAGSSIKLSYGKYPMGRHIALIPKCMTGKACYAPQDPNAVILENAKKGEINMGMTPEQAFAMKKELEHINKQKESLIDGILKKEIEAGTLKGNIFDRTRELWKNDAGVLLEMATVIKKDEPTTKPKVEGKGRDLDLATAIKTGKVDPEDALTMLIENGKLFGE